MKKYILINTLIVFTLLFVGCEKDNSNCPTDAEVILTSEIDGAWKLSDGSRLGILVYNRTIYYSWTNNDTSEYSEAEYSFEITGTKTIQPNDIIVKKVLFTSIREFVTLLTDSKVTEWNGTGHCGYIDWSLNERKQVDGCLNQGYSYDKSIYFLDGDILRWGGGTMDNDSAGYANTLPPYPAAAWERL